jgi:cation:H+ antiporter
VVAVVKLAAGIGLVIVGAEAFFDGLLATARRIGVSAFFLTVLVSGFEIENIVAGLAASLAGFPGAAAGTFLGGTTFIAFGVAGIGALLAPAHATVSRSFVVLTAAAGVPLAVLALDRELSRLDGVLLMAWFATVMVILYRASGAVLDLDTDDEDSERKRYPFAWLLGGLLVMTVGGELLGNGVQAVVARFGISPTLLGNTAIAALTEAEEIGRVAVPARRGRPDVAAANIGGTAIHFLALNAGVIALVRPLSLDAATMNLHLPVAVVAPAVYSLALTAPGGLRRGAGVVLVALYVAYIAASLAGITSPAR